MMADLVWSDTSRQFSETACGRYFVQFSEETNLWTLWACRQDASGIFDYIYPFHHTRVAAKSAAQKHADGEKRGPSEPGE